MTQTQLHHVRLVDVPVARFLEMQQQHDAMLREFSLIALSANDPTMHEVPRRILDVSEEMRARFGVASATFRSGILRAHDRGDTLVTLELQIPFETLRWAEDFLVMFEEGDDFCRQGELLTQPSSARVEAFRRWLVGEVIRQIRDGAAPTPFTD
ncbi:MAG: hypothetical protein ACRDU8_04650 [Egibacteraceae bacterium]